MQTLFMALGGILLLVGWIWIVIHAFKNGKILWGLVSLFIPFGAFFYSFFGGPGSKPAIIYLVGMAMYLVGMYAF